MTESWRDTLFVWDGILLVEKPSDDDAEKDNDDTVKLKWTGKWIGCENCPDAKNADLPKRGFGEHIPSDMEFAVRGTAVPLKQSDDDDQNGTDPHQATLIDGDGWDLKEDDGSKKKHKDTEHDVFLPSLNWTGNPDQRKNLAFALGNNESGSFVAVGWLRPGNRLTLGRRYLDAKDARVNWDVETLRKAVLDEIMNDDGKVTIPPWQCAELHSDIMPPSKKQKVDDSPKDEAKE